jgi:hypothetical protein
VQPAPNLSASSPLAKHCREVLQTNQSNNQFVRKGEAILYAPLSPIRGLVRPLKPNVSSCAISMR